jgi:hypothetical protein
MCSLVPLQAGSVQLEMHFLSQLTGDDRFAAAATRSLDALLHLPLQGGGAVLPIDVHPQRNQFESDRRSIGASGDSYYEYLLKVAMLLKHRGHDHEREKLLGHYHKAVGAIEATMVGRVRRDPPHGGQTWAWLGARASASAALEGNMEHLACFVPGMLALGSLAEPQLFAHHLVLAKELAATCMAMYRGSVSGLAAEHSSVGAAGVTPIGGHKSGLLRPETVESLFVLWRATADTTYRAWGWEIFKSLEGHGRLDEGGYTAVDDVQSTSPKRLDRMDSFFLSETLKYLWLLFSEEKNLPLDQFVLNTEGHPFTLIGPNGPFSMRRKS